MVDKPIDDGVLSNHILAALLNQNVTGTGSFQLPVLFEYESATTQQRTLIAELEYTI